MAQKLISHYIGSDCTIVANNVRNLALQMNGKDVVGYIKRAK